MTDRKYNLAELREMNAQQLYAVAKDLGLKVNKNVNKLECRKRIMAAYAKAAVESDARTPEGPPVETKPANPDFEELAGDGETLADEDLTDTQEHRGGDHGGGRPKGLTAEKARMKNLPQQPNPAIEKALRLLFASWAAKARCAEIALTDAEAFDLALPYTQIAYYMGIDQYIPVWAELAIVAVWNTTNIMRCKLTIIRAAQQHRKEVSSVEVAQEVAAKAA